MILFEKDWGKYPSAIIHESTRNESFKRLSALYRAMGVKNHAFPLALINPDLEHVDPHSPDLTPELIAAIAVECRMNYWYFIREVSRAPSRAGGGNVPFRADRGNIASAWLFFNHITQYLIQIRQTGKTFGTVTLADYLLNIRCLNTQINLLTKDESLRQNTMKDLKEVDEEFPFYLRQRTKYDYANTERLSIKRLGNEYRAHIPNANVRIANNLGRGLTSPIFFIDEGPFQVNIAISMPAALAAGGAARDIAAANNEPYGTVVTTTAGKKDEPSGQYIYAKIQNAAEWSEALLDAEDAKQLELIVRKSSRTGVAEVNCTFNHIQLGYDDAWLMKKLEESGATGEAADRDYFNVWTSGNLLSPLPVDLLDRIRKSQREPNYVEIDKEGYTTRWYIEQESIPSRMARGHYILAMDTSDASGGDDISLFIIDIRSLECVAAGTYNETNLITFGQWVATWFIKYQNLTGVIERRSSGAHLLDHLILILSSKGIDPFKRLFNKVVHDAEVNPERYNEINIPIGRRSDNVYTRFKRDFGFATSGTGYASRSELYSTTLSTMAKKACDKIYDKTTIDQITSLIIKNGRVDHPDGGHDDMVIAVLLCTWLITQGKNLSHYGINSREIMSELYDKAEHIDAAQYLQRQEQYAIRREIEEIAEKIRNEPDEFITMKLEQRLRALDRQIVLNETEIFSVDDMIRTLREDKRRSRQNRPSASYQDSYYQTNHRRLNMQARRSGEKIVFMH